ncbi:MAG: NAD(P)-dependent oxidoreductase, partial [Novibacillus thermophilus]
MLGMNKWLAKREKDGKPVQVGLVGAGQMGRGMVAQIQQMKGMEVAAVCDILPENAAAAYLNAGIPADRIERCNRLSQAQTAVEKGHRVVTEQAEIVLQLPMVEAVIDATGVPEVGAKVACQAIQNRKHIVMLNVEADVTVGAILNKMAQSAGVVYTGAAGDEPAAIMELHD